MDVLCIVTLLDKAAVCPGHPDQQSLSMLDAKKGQLFIKKWAHCHIHEQSFTCHPQRGRISKIRYSSCELVVKGAKCPSYITYHDTLQKAIING